ncbi:MAG: ChaN family lipoprotein [Bacteroidota bacterium]
MNARSDGHHIIFIPKNIMLKNRQSFIFLLIFGLPFATYAQSEDYKIYDSRAGQQIELSSIAETFEPADVLFFGERHDDSIAHHLQDQLYGLLLDRYGQVTLSMEMFETDCQQVVDEYLAGFINERNFVKESRAWGNYDTDYRPMLERAKASEQAVIAANAPRRYVNMVSRLGPESLSNLPKDSRAHLPPLPISTDDDAYRNAFNDAMGGMAHSGMENVFAAQCTWDASMAYRIYKHWRKHKKEKILHLNGSFHTDFGLGTVNQLEALNKKIEVMTISSFPADDFDNPDWASYSTRGDFIILTRPAVSR